MPCTWPRSPRPQISVADLPVRTLVLAGEPGGSIPAVRQRIEEAWQAQVIDHAGATEVGPWGYSDRQRRGVHVLESEFIAEFLSVESGQPAAEGELAELVLTNLGRFGSPVIRYRTGDLVRPVWQHDLDNRFVLLEGGIVGRNDDMLTVRGVNIFPRPSSRIVRSFPEVLEYQAIVSKIDSHGPDHDGGGRPIGSPAANCRRVALAAGAEDGGALRAAGFVATFRGQRQPIGRSSMTCNSANQFDSPTALREAIRAGKFTGPTAARRPVTCRPTWWWCPSRLPTISSSSAG